MLEIATFIKSQYLLLSSVDDPKSFDYLVIVVLVVVVVGEVL